VLRSPVLTGAPANLENNDYGKISGVTPEVGTPNFDADPKFVDATNGNYRLAGDSPLLGALPVSISGNLAFDLAGDAVSFSGFADIGAYEDTVFKDGFEGE
jgi:hypothetical protein